MVLQCNNFATGAIVSVRDEKKGSKNGLYRKYGTERIERQNKIQNRAHRRRATRPPRRAHGHLSMAKRGRKVGSGGSAGRPQKAAKGANAAVARSQKVVNSRLDEVREEGGSRRRGGSSSRHGPAATRQG